MRSQRLEQKQFNLLFNQTKTAVGYILTLGLLPRLRVRIMSTLKLKKSVIAL